MCICGGQYERTQICDRFAADFCLNGQIRLTKLEITISGELSAAANDLHTSEEKNYGR